MFNGFVKPAPLSYYGTTNERTYSAQADFALQARDEFCLFMIFQNPRGAPHFHEPRDSRCDRFPLDEFDYGIQGLLRLRILS